MLARTLSRREQGSASFTHRKHQSASTGAGSMCWYVGVPYNTLSGSPKAQAGAAKSDQNSLTPGPCTPCFDVPTAVHHCLLPLYHSPDPRLSSPEPCSRLVTTSCKTPPPRRLPLSWFLPSPTPSASRPKLLHCMYHGLTSPPVVSAAQLPLANR